MKTTIKSLVPMIFVAALFVAGCSKRQTTTFQPLKNQEVAAQLKSFVSEKEAQANAAAKVDGQELPPAFKPFFAAAAKGDWLAVSNDFENFRKHAPQYEHLGKTDSRLRGAAWQTVLETYGAIEAFAVGNEKYSTAYGNDIIDSIPPGSIYFGGTDPGRFIVTALQKTQVEGDPFFTLTQNALADMTYLDYLRSMYGGKIYIPNAEDSQRCFQEYAENKKLLSKNGQVQISGEVGVMGINGLLVKTIFDKNPDREFYIEESFPLDWMYPYLEPHGLIFKINRQPLSELPEEIVRQDHDYWTKYVQPMIGDWLKDDTSVEEVTAFAKKVFAQKDFNNFNGDPDFIQNNYSHGMFSKLRSSIAGLYEWRMNHSANAAEKERMAHEADFAFRQALALCPYSPEAVYRYVEYLSSQNRLSDALLVAETATQMPQMRGKDGGQFSQLVQQLKQMQNQKRN